MLTREIRCKQEEMWRRHRGREPTRRDEEIIRGRRVALQGRLEASKRRLRDEEAAEWL
jgi:hypothetical protein